MGALLATIAYVAGDMHGISAGDNGIQWKEINELTVKHLAVTGGFVVGDENSTRGVRIRVEDNAVPLIMANDLLPIEAGTKLVLGLTDDQAIVALTTSDLFDEEVHGLRLITSSGKTGDPDSPVPVIYFGDKLNQWSLSSDSPVE